jgi:aromatic-L-amino-acid/L-tryptophan decarboxylase
MFDESPATITETHLDPLTEAEWEEARRAGHRLVDSVLAQHRTVRERACWQPVPADVKRRLSEVPSREGLGLSPTLALAEQLIQPHGTGNLHPRFWGWVLGAGNLPGIFGQWMAAGMNANVFGGDQGLAHLELQVIDWFRNWFGFPEGSSGLLVDGGSMGNILGLAIARHRATEGRCKTEGPEACMGLRVYGSEATHNSIHKGAELLGLGRGSVRTIATDAEGRVDIAAMERAIQSDLERGLRPFCIVGSACTVGVGAVDPLMAMRELADKYGLWLHVDGAIGALGWLSPKLRPRLAGLDLADSLAFDLHKWGQVPYDAGCLLVRDGQLHRETFQAGAEYLGTTHGGIMPREAHLFHAYTSLLSRGDRALKIWTTFMALGTDRLAAVFEQNVEQIDFLAKSVDAEKTLERLSMPMLNILCFRYRGELRDEAALNVLNERILVELQESGFCMMSPYRIQGRFCLRVCISNHRTRREDLAELLRRVVEIGKRLSCAHGSATSF